MDQEDGCCGGGGDMNKQPRPQPQPQPQPPPPPPQRCPRCDSVNTKFCYYNNYSLSQPRYFCKTCRRYWTHGGALRNVPVGGGCRKGKRAKTSSSSAETSRSQPQPRREGVVPMQPNLTASSSRAVGPSSPAAAPSISPYYQGGGYLSSLAAIHSLNPLEPFNQSLNRGSSNLGLLSGFNAASLASSQTHIRPSQIFQTGNRDRVVESLSASEQGLIQTSMMGNRSSASHLDWSQSYRAFDGSLWSPISTTSTDDNSGNNNNNASAGSSSLIPNQWPNLPGYGPPP